MLFIVTVQNLENWLENLRIISSPGLTEYKQKCYLFIFFNFKYQRVYWANKGVVVVVVVVHVGYFISYASLSNSHLIS